jgi:hypothetical protein
MAGTSFLAAVKQEINEAFATQYDELSEVCTDQETLIVSLKATQKNVWEVVEKRLKESFLNGKKTVNGKSDRGEEKPKKANPFRKE